MFGGYERYRLSLISGYYRNLPSFLRRLLGVNGKLRKLDVPQGVDRFALFMFQKDAILGRILRDEFFCSNTTREFFKEKYFYDDSHENFEEAFMAVDRHSWLVDESLVQADKMSMAVGLEARVPLLDKDLVEFSLRIPPRCKVSLFDKKIIMKKAFKERLPEHLFSQPKRGWFSPAAKWLRYPKIYAMAQEILSENYYREIAPLFNQEEIGRILKDHYDKKEYNLIIIWALLTFKLWAKLYKVKL